MPADSPLSPPAPLDLFRLTWKNDSLRPVLVCNACGSRMTGRSKAVWHAKAHVATGEARIRRDAMQPVESRYEVVQ